MTDSSSETTAEMPPVEPPVVADEPVLAAPAPQPQYLTPATSKKTDNSKVLMIIAAVVLGLVVLGGTFASGAVVGAHFAGGRNGAFAESQGRFGGPGAGMNGQDRGPGNMQRRGRRGRGGFGQGQGQGQFAPQGQVPQQAPAAPSAPGGQAQ